MNEILDKLAEYWDFDSTDTTSTYHSVTYGNAKISSLNQAGRYDLYNGELTIGSAIGYYNSYTYTIIKTDSSVMLALGAGSGYYDIWIVGKITNVDGTTGKGIIGVQSDSNWYAVMGDSSQSNVSDTFRASEEVTQLVPYVSSVGGWFFDNAYRLLIGLNSTLKGRFMLGDDVYYIAGRSAIKEV
jgi:hypothetical protein